MKNKKPVSKRILSVTIRHHVDESPDTSCLGEYASRPSSEFSIDRAHSEDCASVSPVAEQAQQTLEHAAEYLASLWDGAPETQNSEDTDAAIETLQTLADEVVECDCGERGDMRRNEYRYFNPSFNYVDEQGHAAHGNTLEDVRKYTRQDYERMESLNRGDWCFIGVTAEAEIGIRLPGTDYYTIQRIHSGGLWGIESDSEDSFIESEERNQLADLKDQLRALGFSARAISKAFEDVKHEDR